jgi:DNA repair protein RadA/Sms
MKVKTAFVCQHCGVQAAKWSGKCASCGTWNSLVEEIIPQPSAKSGRGLLTSGARVATVRPLAQVQAGQQARMLTPDGELNRVLGGGIVPGSVVLVGGEPGIGKSTLMLQVALSLPGKKVLYVSGEESAEQIKMRADRIAPGGGSEVFLLTETQVDTIIVQAQQLQPDLVVIDSIQTLELANLESAPGTVSQVRESAAVLVRYAKENGVPVFLIGHITKEGSLAGPKVLEHMVDTVLQFEGDRHMSYRLLRAAKNRFGASAELGMYEMVGDGLRQVTNPSEVLITQRDTDLSGFTVGVMLEGQRPLLIESQALVSPAAYGTPQRTANGMDGRRLQMLLAVLEKRGGFKLNQQDVFLNIAGGLRIEDPGLDLAICAAIVSSYADFPVHHNVCFAGEVGLGGEVRAVHKVEQRIAEAARLGYKEIFVSSYQKEALKKAKDINVRVVTRITEVFPMLFGE